MAISCLGERSEPQSEVNGAIIVLTQQQPVCVQFEAPSPVMPMPMRITAI